jgi:hypothetical protein
MYREMSIQKLCIVCAFAISTLQVQAQESVELYYTPQEKRDIADLKLNGISIGALLEVEGSVGNESGEDVSDITLATFEFSIEATLNDWVSGRALLLWEEDDTEPIDLDEGVITFGGTEFIPWSLEVGKMYVPFGAFYSHFVSDPLVLELGETRQSAATLGYTSDRLEAKVAAFNGSVNDEVDDQVNELAASVTLTPTDGITVGAYWISNLGESDGLSEDLAGAIDGSDEEPGLPYNRIGGAGVYLHAEVGAVIVEAEYLTALDDFHAGLLGDGEMKPQAWNAELAYTATDKLELAAKYEGSDQIPDMPEAQYGIAASYVLAEKVTVALEYLHGTFEGEVDNSDLVTCQIAIEL